MRDNILWEFLEPNKDKKGKYVIRLSAFLLLMSFMMAIFNINLAIYFIGIAIFLRIVENEE